MAKIHCDIHVTGLVQGVWFRKSTREEALKIGVTGFVRNEPDGSVYIEAEGEPGQMNRFIDWCKHGPERARVREVNVSERELHGFTDFDIAY